MYQTKREWTNYSLHEINEIENFEQMNQTVESTWTEFEGKLRRAAKWSLMSLFVSWSCYFRVEQIDFGPQPNQHKHQDSGGTAVLLQLRLTPELLTPPGVWLVGLAACWSRWVELKLWAAPHEEGGSVPGRQCARHKEDIAVLSSVNAHSESNRCEMQDRTVPAWMQILS
jgi:hypothetical protein